MIPTPLRFAVGDVIVIKNQEGRETLWRILKRIGGGYDTEPLSAGDRRLWTDTELDLALCNRRLRHIPFDSRGLSKNSSDALSRTWEYWSEKDRIRALRRLEFVRRVDAIAPLRVGPPGDAGQAARRGRCVRAGELLEVEGDRVDTLKDAYLEAANQVWEENKDQWVEDERVAQAIEDEEEKKRRKQRPRDRPRKRRKPLKRPSASAVRDWWFRWDESNGDVRSLIAHDQAKGNRTPYYPQTAEGGETTYRLMAWAVDEHVVSAKRPNAKAVWREIYKKKCKAHHLPFVTYETFRTFVNSRKNGKCGFEVFRRRYGIRAAKLRYKIYERTTPPDRPLQEVEVDHCLIDLVVRHPITKRVLGRPWLTAIIDRATHAVLGGHLGFEIPSYSSLQRALAHAFWRKDISDIADISGDWPMHGIPEWIFSDNGREFRSASLRLSEAMLDFAVVNLPAKQPHLKGMVERIFQTMGVQIFSLEEGSILARSEIYEPTERAQLSLAEINHKILKWIVEEYHNEPHPALKKKSPNEAWIEKTALYPVRPVPDFDHIVRLTGETIQRNISNVGVQYEGFLFSDAKVLEDLRINGGLDREWTLRVDPYNYGEIWILDELGGRWVTLPNTDPDISVGVSRFQHRVHERRAKALAEARGAKTVTTKDLLNAKTAIQSEAEAVLAHGSKTGPASMAARYQTNGELFTPLYGGGSMLRPTLGNGTTTWVAEAAPSDVASSRPEDSSAGRAEEAKKEPANAATNRRSKKEAKAPPSSWSQLADGVCELTEAW